jgi:hypothetical protein
VKIRGSARIASMTSLFRCSLNLSPERFPQYVLYSHVGDHRPARGIAKLGRPLPPTRFLV